MKRLSLLSAILLLFLFVHPAFSEKKDEDTSASPGTSYDTAEELMTVLEMEKSTNDLITNAVDAQIKQDPRAAAARDKMYELLTKYIGWKAIHDDIKNIWKGQFTEPEMRELIAFYKSPIGKKYIHVQISLFDQSNIAIQQRMTQHMPELLMLVKDEIKRAGAAQTPAPKGQ